MTIRLLSLLVVSASLIACAKEKGTDAVDKDGQCTETTRNYYNSLYDNARAYAKSGDPQLLKNVVNDCNRFKGFIGDQSCSGIDENGKEITVTQATITEVCTAAQDVLKDLSLKKNQKSDSDPGDQILPAPGSENKAPKKGGKSRGRG